jgi:hypothetical protein
MGELSRVAWLAKDPPPWSTREAEAAITGVLLMRYPRHELEVAIAGARVMLKNGQPFSIKLLNDIDLFKLAYDVGVKREVASPAGQAKFVEALRRAIAQAS